MKRFMAFLFAICISVMTVPASVADATSFGGENCVENGEIDYMSFNFPDDAVVLYQGEDGVIYQSASETAERASLEEASTLSDSPYYNAIWLDKGDNSMGTFSIKNLYTLVNTTNGVFKIESDYSDAEVGMLLRNSAGTEALVGLTTVRVKDGDISFSFKSHSSNLTVHYYPYKTSWVYAIRVLCRLW